MLNLNYDILKILKYDNISEFDKDIYDYLQDFENVYNDPNYLNKKVYLEKFTYLYNLCNKISMLKSSQTMFDIFLFYKFIYLRSN